MSQPEGDQFSALEEIFNWTYPGATLYYRDCALENTVFRQFQTGMILRNGYFLDVSSIGGGLHFNTRFLIASSKAAKLYKVNPAVAKYGHCCINANSYLKILDIHTIGAKSQIFMLHIPAKGIEYFSQTVSNMDDNFVTRARQSFEERVHQPPVPDLIEAQWVERTNFPVGMDGYNKFYPMDSLTPLPRGGLSLFEGIKNLTNDRSDLNVPDPIERTLLTRVKNAMLIFRLGKA